MAKPSDENNPDCLPCLFLQFPVRENGARVYKILQVFSRQVEFSSSLLGIICFFFFRDNVPNDVNFTVKMCHTIGNDVLGANDGYLNIRVCRGLSSSMRQQ
jgi:hypothetical protein